jgi:hypothetical protein
MNAPHGYMRAIALSTDSRSAMLGSRISKPLFFHCLTSSHHLHDRAWVPKNHHHLAFLLPFFSICYLFLLLRLTIHRLSASNPVTNPPALPYTTKQFRYCGLGSIKGSSAVPVGRWRRLVGRRAPQAPSVGWRRDACMEECHSRSSFGGGSFG